jgi:hypothetical protein
MTPKYKILEIFNQSFGLEETIKNKLAKNDIYLLAQTDSKELHMQLFGR